jgi:hypothetical protein
MLFAWHARFPRSKERFNELKESAEFLWEVVEETRDHALTMLDPRDGSSAGMTAPE